MSSSFQGRLWYHNGRLYAIRPVSTIHSVLYYSNSAGTWTNLVTSIKQQNGVGNGTFSAIWVVDHNNVYACGNFRYINNIDMGCGVAKWNGIDWQPIGNPSGVVSTSIIYLIAASGSYVYALGPSNAHYKYDGSSWSVITTGAPAGCGALYSMDGDLYSAGTTLFTKYNSATSSWSGSNLFSISNFFARAIAYDNVNSRFVLAGGGGVGFISCSLDGTTNNLGYNPSQNNYGVCCVGGNIYVSGWPTSGTNILARNVKMYNGTSWSEIGAANLNTSGQLGVVADSNNNVYVMPNSGSNPHAWKAGGGFSPTAWLDASSSMPSGLVFPDEVVGGGGDPHIDSLLSGHIILNCKLPQIMLRYQLEHPGISESWQLIAGFSWTQTACPYSFFKWFLLQNRVQVQVNGSASKSWVNQLYIDANSLEVIGPFGINRDRICVQSVLSHRGIRDYSKLGEFYNPLSQTTRSLYVSWPGKTNMMVRTDLSVPDRHELSIWGATINSNSEGVFITGKICQF